MKLLKPIKIELAGQTYNMAITVRARINFEAMAEKDKDLGDTDNLFRLFYCANMAGEKLATGDQPDINYDDWVDNLPVDYVEALKRFTKILEVEAAGKKKRPAKG